MSTVSMTVFQTVRRDSNSRSRTNVFPRCSSIREGMMRGSDEGVAKWPKAGDCKSPIREFESRRSLRFFFLIRTTLLEGTLGRLTPPDWEHVDKHRMLIATAVEKVERILSLPYSYRVKYDQGAEGACVGFASSWLQSIHNRVFYDARWLYREAQLVDSWA